MASETGMLTLLLHGRHAPPTHAEVGGQGRDAVEYQPLGQWIVPWRFDSFEAEYEVLRAGAGLIDYSTQAFIEVRGRDRATFLNALLTNDIKRLSPGTGCRAALLDPSAKVIAELAVLADPDAIWLLCDLSRSGVVAQTLDRHHFSEEISLTNHERRWAALALQGPRTMDLLRPLFGVAGPVPQPGDHAVVALQDLTIRLVHSRLTDEPGLLCLVRAEEALAVWGWLSRRGREMGLSPVGWEALNTARIEAGIPWFGIDMDTVNLLPETGLEEQLASETKGCYVGQEIIARVRTYGSANKRLMGLLIEGDDVPETGDPMMRGGELLGHVTSACRSPALRRPIAMGYVKRGAYEPGTAVEILHGTDRLRATITTRPFIPPKG
ncbi:MAG: aminomethyl transferase family protein [Candidatus Omnitrophica bacterium]|nr:aminomethyl transferase family protein [Candidatus Omnitrophota bacterium]